MRLRLHPSDGGRASEDDAEGTSEDAGGVGRTGEAESVSVGVFPDDGVLVELKASLMESLAVSLGLVVIIMLDASKRLLISLSMMVL